MPNRYKYFESESISDQIFNKLNKLEELKKKPNGDDETMSHAMKRYGANTILAALAAAPAVTTFAISNAIERRKYKKALENGDINASQNRLTPFVLGAAVGAMTGAMMYQSGGSAAKALNTIVGGDKYTNAKGKPVEIGGVGRTMGDSVTDAMFPKNPMYRAATKGVKSGVKAFFNATKNATKNAKKKAAESDFDMEKQAKMSEEKKEKIKKNLKRIGIAAGATAALAGGAALGLKAYNAKNQIAKNNVTLAKNLAEYNKLNPNNQETMWSARKLINGAPHIGVGGDTKNEIAKKLGKGVMPVRPTVKGGTQDLLNNKIKPGVRNAAYNAGKNLKDIRNSIPRGIHSDKGDFAKNVQLKDTISRNFKKAAPGAAIGIGMKMIADADERAQRKFDREMAEKRKKQQAGEQEEKTASFTSSLGKNLGKVGNAFKSGYRSIPKETHKINPKLTAAGMVKGVAGAAAGIGASVAADTLFNKYRQYQDKKDREDEQRRIKTQQQVALHRKLNN